MKESTRILLEQASKSKPSEKRLTVIPELIDSLFVPVLLIYLTVKFLL